MKTKIMLSLLLLAACDPQQLADKALRRTAQSVVQPVLARELPGAQADIATECVLNAASPEEINALARDLGVEAGSQTIANIRNLALRPSAAACLAAGGIPPLKG